MSARDVIERAEAAGVQILADNGELVLRGDQLAIASLVPAAKAYKAELLDTLNKRGKLPKDLQRRIEYVAAFYGFTHEELREAKEIAASDIENAKSCFSALFDEIVVKNEVQ